MVKDSYYIIVNRIWTRLLHPSIQSYLQRILLFVCNAADEYSKTHLDTYCLLNTVSCVLNLSRNPLSSSILLRTTREFPFPLPAFLQDRSQCAAPSYCCIWKHISGRNHIQIYWKMHQFLKSYEVIKVAIPCLQILSNIHFHKFKNSHFLAGCCSLGAKYSTVI